MLDQHNAPKPSPATARKGAATIGFAVAVLLAIGLTETEESNEGFRSLCECASLAHAHWDIYHSRRG